MPASRFAPSLVVLLLGCTAMTCGLAGPAQAWSLFGGKTDTAKTAEKAAAEKSAMTMNENVEDGVRQAQALRLAGNYPEAIRHLSQLMMVASDDPGVVSEYGKTLAAQGRAEDAVNFLTRAQQLRPGDWTLYSAMGVAQDQLGKHDLARTAYEAGLRLRPEEASILSNYALSRLLAKDPDGARALTARAERAGGGSDAKIARNIALVREMVPASQAPATPQAATATTPAPVQHVATAQAQQAPARIAPVAASVAAPVATPAPIPAATKTAPPMTAAPITVAARPVQSVPFVNLPSPAAAPQPAPHPVSGAGPVIQAMPPAPSRVVMQQVPTDPLAGPVKNRVATRAPRALTPPQAAPVLAKAETQTQEKPLEKSQPKPAPQMAAANTPQTEAQALQARAEALAKAMMAQPTKAVAAPVKAAEAKPLKMAPVKTAPAKTAEAPKPAPAAAKPAAPVKTAEAAKPKDSVPALRMSANAY